jgi:hypothetical protein
MLNVLLSGAAGAIFVAIITIAYTEFREARQAVRECTALARLLSDEVERNEGLIEVTRPPPADTAGNIREILKVFSTTELPTADAWIQTRVRLSHIERQDFKAIADYYEVVRSFESPSGATRSYRVRGDERGWKDRTSDVKERLARYAEPNRIWRQLGV